MLARFVFSLSVYCSCLWATTTLAQSVQPPADPVDALAPLGWENAMKIWEWAEPGYLEVKSSRLLSDWLEASGFRVERGVYGMPTAFVAEYGSGAPVVAILGEFDALPGLSQEAVPTQQPRTESHWGHGCGHHLFGVASAMAAIGLAQQMQSEKLAGTVRYYGCPAEEGGSAKVFLVRDGAFKDVDFALHWHPSSTNSVAPKQSLARIAVRFRFHGRSAHAASAPEQGRSALDAVEVTNFSANLMREHVPQQTRMHYVITDGGKAPNVIPDTAEVYYYIRHPQAEVVRELYKRLVNCAEAGALATGTKLEIKYEGGISEMISNVPLTEQLAKNFALQPKLKWTEADLEFALKVQQTFAKPVPLDSIEKVTSTPAAEGALASTDVGDVCWVVPTAGFTVASWVPGTPGHSWQAVAGGTTDLARQSMVLAAKVLEKTGHDLLTQPQLREETTQAFRKQLQSKQYTPLIEPTQAPPLDYRKSVLNKPGE